MTVTITPLTPVFAGEVGAIDLRQVHDRESVSYTHLTLPTIYSV